MKSTDFFAVKQFFEEENEEFRIDQPVFAFVDGKKRCLPGKIKWTGNHYAIYGSKLAVIEFVRSYFHFSNRKIGNCYLLISFH